jgi:hypothetical protein
MVMKFKIQIELNKISAKNPNFWELNIIIVVNLPTNKDFFKDHIQIVIKNSKT